MKIKANKTMLLKVNCWAKTRPSVAFSKLRRYVVCDAKAHIINLVVKNDTPHLLGIFYCLDINQNYRGSVINILSKTQKLLLLGLLGSFIFLALTHFYPAAFHSPYNHLSNFYPIGILFKAGFILIFIGFLGFYSETPDSYKKTVPNTLRVIIISIFIYVAKTN